MSRILLLLPTTTYRARDLLSAASRLGVDVIVGSDRRQALEQHSGGATVTLDFADVEAAALEADVIHRRAPLRAVIGADDETTLLAATIAARLGLPHNRPEAVAASGNKHSFRQRQLAADRPCPWFQLFDARSDGAAHVEAVPYPCVLKPTFLSASRGVIRADDPVQFGAAWRRIRAILADPEVRQRGGSSADQILVESYLPGNEFALEGVLTGGALQPLAVFDKPDSLEGPYFEETLYVTPARIAAELTDRITREVQHSVAAVGLTEGPVHAEVRVHDEAVTVLEIAPRSIGGLCGRSLRFGAGISLEELILRHALGDTAVPPPQSPAAGVMMIPVPRAGLLRGCHGVERALTTPGVDEITLGILTGQPVVPTPEGNRYLGFIVARASSPDEVEESLREAHGHLRFDIVPDNDD